MNEKTNSYKHVETRMDAIAVENHDSPVLPGAGILREAFQYVPERPLLPVCGIKGPYPPPRGAHHH